jgi:hypothetical protein
LRSSCSRSCTNGCSVQERLQLLRKVLSSWVLSSWEVADARGGLSQRLVSAVAKAMGVPGDQSTVSRVLRRLQ